MTGWPLLFKRQGKFTLDIYTDSDFSGSLVDHRTTTGYCTFLAGNLITWRSKKQEVISRITEGELWALAHGITEIVWIKNLLKELRIEIETPSMLFRDNKLAISVAHNPVQHDNMKHVNIDRHLIQETLERKKICTPYIQSAEQCADVLTKGLPKEQFLNIIGNLGLFDIHSSPRGGVLSDKMTS